MHLVVPMNDSKRLPGPRRRVSLTNVMLLAATAFVLFLGFWDVFLLGRYGSMADVLRRLLQR